jgi:release factor glutamine methyltransferase
MNEHAPTIAQALGWAAEQLRTTSPTARLDAELLLAHVLGWDRARLLAEGRMPLDQQRENAFRGLVARRAALEPIAYLVGHKEFYGLDLAVDARVLVPRPETELLVELALLLARRRTNDKRPKEIERDALVLGRSSLILADIGTGSGAIAIALAIHLPEAQIIAIDISPAALELARRNVERYGLTEQVRLLQGDLLKPLDGPVDLIVSNPPYTILSAIDEGVRRHEPRQALDGGVDGLELYRRLLAAAPAKLRPGGAMLLEIGATQAATVTKLAHQAFPGALVSVYLDLAGLDRVVVINTEDT